MGRRYHYDRKGRYKGYSDSEGPGDGGDGCAGCLALILVWWFIATLINGCNSAVESVVKTIFFWT